MCAQCEAMVQQDDARVLAASLELKDALSAIEKHQLQFTELSLEQLHPESSIPITFTKVGPTFNNYV